MQPNPSRDSEFLLLLLLLLLLKRYNEILLLMLLRLGYRKHTTRWMKIT
jgi:hypothetical protein